MFDQSQKGEQSSRQRMSVEDSTAKLVFRIRDTTKRLTELWDDVHMEQSMRESRVEHAYLHFYTLLDDIVKSEEDMVNGVKSDIGVRRLAIADLREMLKMPDFNDAAYPANSIAMVKALDKELHQLAKIRDEAIKVQLNQYELMCNLCFRLDTEPILSCAEVKSRRLPCSSTPRLMYSGRGELETGPINGASLLLTMIIDDEKLQTLRVKTEEMGKVLEERLDQLFSLQSECKKIQETLSHHCKLNRDEVILLDRDFSIPSSVVSTNVIQAFIALEQKLKDQYDDWIEQVAFRYDELLVKMSDLSKKCFNANMEPKYSLNCNPGELGERGIQELEADLKLLEEKYERGKPVFDKLNEWMTLWREKLDAERRVCRASFYKNRGGALTSTLKRQKQVGQQVPKVFEELRAIVADYVLNYNASDIYVEGMLPDKYAEAIIEEYQRDKDVQKAQKQFSKKPSGKENTTGTVKSMRSVFKTSHDLVSPAPSTTTTISRKRSFSCSQLSLISPTKPPLPLGAPITSSPKTRRLSPVLSVCSSNQTQTLLKTPRPAITPQKNNTTRKGRPITPGRPVTPGRPWY